MLAIKSDFVWFLIILHVSNCARRIQNGLIANAEKPYVVYLVKAPPSKIGYDYWLCGGALVTSDFVVTSAACIKDVDYLYVIAGYKKYVTDDNINHDPCTSEKKKKVIYTCYPEKYELDYGHLDKWSLIDIGLAKVESPYDFSDQTYKTICSYIPNVITINYDVKYQEAGTDAIVFGWGHRFKWRKPEDRANYNQNDLNYAPVMLIDKKECADHYLEHGKMTNVIDTYMICTLGEGNINDFGEQVTPDVDDHFHPSLNGCNGTKRRSLAFNPEEHVDDCEEYEKGYQYDGTRRKIIKSNHSRNDSIKEIRNKNNDNRTRAEINRPIVSSKTGLSNRTVSTNRTASINRTASYKRTSISKETGVFNKSVRNRRRYGICQNDHGGPLVTWVGTHETLIGVASVFKVGEDYLCAGPFLYTSTQCNGAFIDCILTQNYDEFEDRRSSNTGTVDNNHRRSFCKKKMEDKRHPTVERHISWLHHPAGAADHERHLTLGRNEPEVNERGRNVENVNMNKMRVNPTNERYPMKMYPLNQKSSVNIYNAPNERYTANKKYVLNDNNAPNINRSSGSSYKYVANNQYAVVHIPVMPKDKLTPYYMHASNKAPALNNGPAQNNKPTQNEEPAWNNGYVLDINRAQNHGPATNIRPELNVKYAVTKQLKIIKSNNAKLMMRPQIPL